MPRLRRVLLVEDSEADAEVVRRILRRLAPEAEVVHAPTIAEGVAACFEERPDVLLLDNQLTDGYAADLLSKISSRIGEGDRDGSVLHKRRGVPACPVVVLTSSGDERLVVRLLRLGAGDYLPKSDLSPADASSSDAMRWSPAVEALGRSITHAVEQHRLARRAARLRESAIRKRRRERTARAEAEAVSDRLSRVLSSVSDGVVSLDKNLRFTFANAAAEQLLDRPASVLIGGKLFDLFPDLTDDEFGRAVTKARAERQDVEVSGIFPGLDRYFNARFYPDGENGVTIFFLDVTEQHTLDERRRTLLKDLESEQARLTAVLNHLPAAVFVAEAPSGRIVRTNEQRVREVLRFSPRAADSVAHYDRWVGWHDDGRPVKPEEWPLARAVTDGEAIDGEELQLEFGDGDRGWISISGGPIRNGDGDITAALVTVQDVTARKRVEADLAGSEKAARATLAQVQSIYRTVPIGLAYVDATLVCQNATEAFAGLHGSDGESLVGRPLAEVLSPALMQQVGPAFEQVLRTAQPVELEVKEAGGAEQASPDAADDSGRILYVTCSPVVDEQRVTGLHVVMQDLTDRIRSRRQLERQAKQLAEQKRQLEQGNLDLARATSELTALLTNAPVGFSFFDRDYRYQRINEPLSQINGLSVDEHLGRTVREVLPDVADSIEPLLERVFETGRSVVGAEIEGQTPRAPGQARWWLVSFFPVVEAGTGARPGVRAVGCVVLEISDRKRAEQMLREAKENAVSARISADRARETAERANRAKSEFLAVLSHELRTPLTPVLAATQMLERELHQQSLGDGATGFRGAAFGTDGLDEEQRGLLSETLSMIRRNVELEVRLIDDLLDLTRITRGKLQFARRPVDLNDAARHVVEICGPDVADKELRIVSDLSPGPLTTVADPARVQQVMWNLIKNAVKFTPEGGEIRVRTFAATHQGRPFVGCEVSDNGLGIEADKLKSIFNAFEQGGRAVTRTFGGLGLGLTISRHLVDAHGGSLFARSAGVGQGAQFTLLLPASAHKPVAQREPTTSGPAAIKLERVLLVEDHADTARLMARFLKLRLKVDVVRAGSVGEARACFKDQGPFDLIISDIGLPDGTGTELISSLPPARPPAIALSGYGTEADVQRSRDAGFAEHLVKPVDLDRLDQTVRRVLSN